MFQVRNFISLFSFGFIIQLNVSAQSQLIDSLKNAYRTQTNDTMICKALNQLASKERSEGWQKYYIELQERADKGLAKYKDTNHQKFYKFQIYCAKEYAAYFERLKGNNDLSIQLHLEAYRYAEELKKFNSMGNINNSIAQLYYLKADAKNALDYYQKALTNYERINDSSGMAKVLNNIGTVHNDFGEKELARAYFKNALGYSLSLQNPLLIGSGYNNIGSVLADEKKYDSALYYFLKAQPFYQDAGLLYEEGTTLTNIGSMYQFKNEKSKALSYFEQGLERSKQAESSEGIASSYCYLADIWFELNNLEKAKQFAESALTLGNEMGTPDIISKAAFQLSRIYKSKGDYKKAFEMNELYTQMKDSIDNEDAKRILMKSQFQFEYGKKAAADSLKSLKDKEVLSLQIEKEKNQKIFLFSFLGLAILAGGFVFNRYRVTQQQKKVIESNNNDLKRQHLLNQKIFSVISHDFRGPMISLGLLLNSFKKNKPSPELEPYINELGSQIDSSNSMMSNLLNWAKTELNLHVNENQHANLSLVCNEIEQQVRVNLANKNISLKKQIDDSIDIALPIDVLKIVIRNVLSNAIKFSHENSKIVINFQPTKNQLTITDYGVGMSKEKATQLFKKDVVPSIGTNYENGFGMGLYIVAELLQKYGGQIAVDSEIDKGTKFMITFAN